MISQNSRLFTAIQNILEQLHRPFSVQNLRHCKQGRQSPDLSGNGAGHWGKNRGSGQIRQTLSPVRGCVGLWRRGWHPGDAEAVAGRVRPVWAEVGKGGLRGYLQRKKRMGGGTAAAVLWVKSGSFGRPKKVLDKGGGRWRPPPAHKAPQCGAFRDSGTDVGFRYFQDLGGRSGKKSSVSKRLRRVVPVPISFLSENEEIASLYQR